MAKVKKAPPVPKVYAPNMQYNGISAGVQFVDGVGETADPRKLHWFRTHGYAVDEPAGGDADDSVADITPKAEAG